MLHTLLTYKRWANQTLCDVAREQGAALPEDEHRLFVRILNHTHVVDRIFAAHLQGQPHAHAATNTPDTPALADLQAAMLALDGWLCDYAQNLSAAQRQERLAFRFTDGQAGCMTREEMLHHLVTHGAHHRGAAGRVLAAHGIQPPPDSPAVFWHLSQPERRWPSAA
ncbi:MAG: DinB family protein [Pseudomonadota bacterium]|nr:DinB family protein [Pseudomonadota bacterium]